MASNGIRKICPDCARFNPGWQTCRWCGTEIVVINGEVFKKANHKFVKPTSGDTYMCAECRKSRGIH